MPFFSPPPIVDSTFAHAVRAWDPQFGGIYADAGRSADVVITSGSLAFSSYNGIAQWSQANVGAQIWLQSGYNYGLCNFIIATVSADGKSGTFAAASGYSGVLQSGAAITAPNNTIAGGSNACWGHDDTPAMTAASAFVDQVPSFVQGSDLIMPAAGVMYSTIALDSRCSIRGQSQMNSATFHKPGATSYHITAKSATSYKQEITDLSYEGCAAYQTSGVGFINHGGTSATSPEVDTFNGYHRLQINQPAQDGITYAQRGQSKLSDIDVQGAFRYAYNWQGYDCTIINSDGNSLQVGWYHQAVAASTRVTNCKMYFCGQGQQYGSNAVALRDARNASAWLIKGQGTFTACDGQETWGHNWVIQAENGLGASNFVGTGSLLNGCKAGDTGDVYQAQNAGNQTYVPPVLAGLYLGGARYNELVRFRHVTEVLLQAQYSTHGLYLDTWLTQQSANNAGDFKVANNIPTATSGGGGPVQPRVMTAGFGLNAGATATASGSITTAGVLTLTVAASAALPLNGVMSGSGIPSGTTLAGGMAMVGLLSGTDGAVGATYSVASAPVSAVAAEALTFTHTAQTANQNPAMTVTYGGASTVGV